MDIENRFKWEETLEEVVARRDSEDIEESEHRCADMRDIGETHYDWSIFETNGRRDSLITGLYDNVWYPLTFIDFLDPHDLETRGTRR